MKVKTKRLLNEGLAKRILKDCLKKIKNKEDREWLYLHSKLMREASLILAKNEKINTKALKIAAWVHDIGYIKGNGNHAKYSIEILEKEYKVKIDPVVKDCILNHTFGKKPKTKEGKIFQVADKLFIINRDFLEYLKKFKREKKLKKEEVDFIKKVLDRVTILMRDYKF